MNRPGPGPQPLRGLSGFPGQSAPQNRNVPLGSARLQNGKLGNTSNWGFAAGLPTPQGRPPRNNTSGSISQQLDLSEFPSLGGGPQPQYQTPGQAIWANANQRAGQQIPVQRPQHQAVTTPGANTQQQQSSQSQDQGQQSLDDAFFPSQFSGSLDEYRHANQGVGQHSTSNQAQATNIDEFPPLNRNEHGEVSQDRRGNLIQNAVSGGYGGASNFAHASNLLSTRQAEIFTPNNAANRILSPISNGAGGSQAPGFNGVSDQDKNMSSRPFGNGSNDDKFLSNLLDGQVLNERKPSTDHHPALTPAQVQDQGSRAPQFQPGFVGDLADSPSDTHPRAKTPLSQMSDIDRFGLKGLLAMTDTESPDYNKLAAGHDLTTLGLDLNSSEPLWPTFAGPFSGFAARPLQPEFTLPQCYTVHNTCKVEDKIASFSDETLLYMFYTMPRDVMQEIAAIELTSRNWRYHKELKCWLTKDQQYGDPRPISHEAEQGRYVVFNEKAWQRESREMILRWADLDDHISMPPRPNMM